MYDIQERIEKEIEDLKFLIKGTKRQLRRKDPGALAVKTCNGAKYYYESKMKNGKLRQDYLGTADDERVGEFIIRKVMKLRLKILKDNLKVLEKTREQIRDYTTESILALLGDEYKMAFWGIDELRELYQLNDRLPWKVQSEYPEPPDDKDKVFDRDVITCDGKRVRSLGECIIYDILKAAHIRFQYEPTLYFYDENYNDFEINPDFYIECKDGSHIIIEHLGKLGDKEYADTQEHKLRTYHLNGYDLGHNLIFTSGNSSFGLDSSFISDIIYQVILPRAKTVA